MMLFNELLIKRRKELHMTQDELADMLDVSRQSVSKWENGECMPDSDKLIRLSDVLSISLDELIGRKESTAPTEKGSAAPLELELPAVKGNNRAWLPRVLTAGACAVIGVACFFAGRASAANKNEGPILAQSYGLLAEFDENGDISSIEQFGSGEDTYVEEIVSIDREAIVSEMYKYLIENEPDLSEDEAMSIAEEIVNRFEKIETEYGNGNTELSSYYSIFEDGRKVFNMGKLIDEVLSEKRQ